VTTYCIFTPKTMYTIEAAYFKASDIGIMFFDDKDDGIGFVPTHAFDMVKTWVASAPGGNQSAGDSLASDSTMKGIPQGIFETDNGPHFIGPELMTK
jgi:hypothetical protein